MRAKLQTFAVMAAVAVCLGVTVMPERSATIDNFAFTPEELTVAMGTTIVWINRDDTPHTVTSADTPRPFKSAPLDTGDTFSHRFDHVGRFAYFCSLHAHMRGIIVVK